MEKDHHFEYPKVTPIERYVTKLVKEVDPEKFFPFPPASLPDNVIELRPDRPDIVA